MKFMSIFYLIGVAQAVLLIIVLLKKDRFNSIANRLLITSLISILIVLGQYALGRLDIRIPFLATLPEIFWFALGPILYLYVLALTDSDFRFKPIYISFFTFSIYNLIHYISFQFGNRIYLYHLINDVAIYTYLFIYAYLLNTILFSGLTLYQLKQYLKDNAPAKHQFKWMYNYFTLFLVLILLSTFALTFLISSETYSNRYEFTLLLLYEAFVLILAYKAMNQPEYFIYNKLKYSNSTLTADDFNALEKKLNSLMNDEKPFLNKHLKLSDLAAMLTVPQHQLSQLLNQQLQTNFYDYINKFRVEEAERKLSAPENKHFKIMSLAHDAGFQSKASFYRSFKKHYDMTPLEFLDKQNIKT